MSLFGLLIVAFAMATVLNSFLPRSIEPKQEDKSDAKNQRGF